MLPKGHEMVMYSCLFAIVVVVVVVGIMIVRNDPKLCTSASSRRIRTERKDGTHHQTNAAANDVLRWQQLLVARALFGSSRWNCCWPRLTCESGRFGSRVKPKKS
jgi:hypothetical protein